MTGVRGATQDGVRPQPPAAGRPRHRLDDVMHAPVRFSVVAAPARITEAEFGWIRDAVGVSDSALSKQVSTLELAGCVHVRKGYVGKRPRTWLRLSARGRDVYVQHVQALREIAEGEGAGYLIADLPTPASGWRAALGELPRGWLLLTCNANPVLAHWGRVTRLQTALSARGTGVARALMTELHRRLGMTSAWSSSASRCEAAGASRRSTRSSVGRWSVPGPARWRSRSTVVATRC